MDGFVFRWNRHRHRRACFDSLPGIGPELPPATYLGIVEGCARRGQGVGAPLPQNLPASRKSPPSGSPQGGAGAFSATDPGTRPRGRDHNAP